MPQYLKSTLSENKSETTARVNHYEFRNRPFSVSDVFLTQIGDSKLLTKGEDVKRVYDLKLSTKRFRTFLSTFLPGDTIGILPRNDPVEVDKLLVRLNVEAEAEKWYNLSISEDTTKKNATIPKHIPISGVFRDIFTYYVDIRKPPKKLFLKALIPYTRDPQEAEKLQEVCSPKGSKQYSDLITGSAQTLSGLLNKFPSCSPPVEVILEHSSPLQPRYFSIASSPLENDALHITFFVVENEDGTKGVCTGWLEELVNLNESQRAKIPIYFRKPNNFRIPSDSSLPLVMVATGTGLAPFKGFLDHRLLLRKNGKRDTGDAVLFYGCRYRDRDFLYAERMEEYLDNGALTKLYTAFSRDGEEKCYVQNRIDRNGEEFVNYVLNKNAVIYVCGNMKTVVKDVKEAVVNNLVEYGDLDLEVAREYLNELVKNDRFVIDSWS
ncbi:hypothetical protein NQ318_013843 [Aromia moschata]|uniref:Methionine synthase reductase n=1 Tax=Aromia moschata TaxID=1265417 RepID=A0AAV8Z9G9_9CUCU|nr:hypothetical protein NQ318_013843 [Aromia moschata]